MTLGSELKQGVGDVTWALRRPQNTTQIYVGSVAQWQNTVLRMVSSLRAINRR